MATMTNSRLLRQMCSFYLSLTALLQLGEATPMPEKTQRGIVSLPVAHKNVAGSAQRRQVSVPLENSVSSYQVQLELGSPPQPVAVSLDTGSSDLWVYGPGSCSTCKGGVYDPTHSSTSVSDTAVGPLNIGYFDGSKAQGYYVTDDVVIAGTTVSSAVIGVATSAADRGHSLFGIGLEGLEAVANPYPNFIDDMWAQGIINSRTYSLYLDDRESSTGSIIFGGIDSSKYTGNLVTLPIVPSSDGRPRLSVDWSSISIADGQQQINYVLRYLPYPVVLDTGYTFSVLGNDVWNAFATYFNVQNTSTPDLFSIDCNQPDGHVNIGFGHDDFILQIPFSELAVPNVFNNEGGCVFGFVPAGTNDVISFGDTVLRSAYVFYDYTSKMISMAQASFDQSCTNCATAV